MCTRSTFIRAAIIFITAFVLISLTLYMGEDVSLGNNGDFYRIANLCSLIPDGNGGFTIAVSDAGYCTNIGNFLFTPTDISVYPSVQLIFVRLAVAMSYTANIIGGGAADIYNPLYLSLMQTILCAAALAFALLQFDIKNKIAYWATVAVSLVMLCDIGYVSYFNSLYGEGLQHIFLIVVVGFILMIWKKPLNATQMVLYALALIFYGQTKFFNIPIAIALGLLGFVISLRHGTERKSTIMSATAVAVVIVALMSTYLMVPDWINKEVNYNSVFYGIVKECDEDTAKEYLAELGLDPALSDLRNTNHYVSDFADIAAEYDIEGAENISKLRLLMFYVKHPGVALSGIGLSFNHSAQIRNIFFMDEDYMNDITNCTLWSKVRENSGFDTPLLNLAVMAVFAALLILTFARARVDKYITAVAVMIIAGVFAYTVFIPYVSNGEGDLAKHMFPYIELLDISLIAIVLMCTALPRRLCVAVVAVMVVMIAVNTIPHKRSEIVTLGGKQWQVIDENDTFRTLIARDIAAYRSIDTEPSNNYAASDIHKWLNEEFIATFSAEEMAHLYKNEEKIILSAPFAHEAESGDRDFYCCALPAGVGANYDTAYGHNVSAYVFLPTAEHISAMADRGCNTVLDSKYWLSTPYFNNGGSVRYVNPDGLVYFAPATEELGIRPVIYMKHE